MGRDTDSRTNITSRRVTLTYDISKRSKLRRRSPRTIRFQFRAILILEKILGFLRPKSHYFILHCGIFWYQLKIIRNFGNQFFKHFPLKIQVLLKVIFRQLSAFWESFLFFKNSIFWQSVFQAFSIEKYKSCSKWFLGDFKHSEQAF